MTVEPYRDDARPRATTAVVCSGSGAALVALPTRPLGSRDVRVAVRCVGLCRTDVLVAQGAIAVEPRRVLGHEGAGVIAARGADVRHLAIGDRVTLLPFVPCGTCAGCAEGAGCPTAPRLGIERDGVFADEVVVPAQAVRALPRTFPFRLAAYVEPVAASLAAAHAGLDPTAAGTVLGEGRIAMLTRRVLAAVGFSQLRAPSDVARGELGWVVETAGTAESVARAVELLAPRGVLVLKSRPAHEVPLPLGVVVRRELVLRAVSYGPFDEAIALLASGRLEVGDLLGVVRPLADLVDALRGGRDESVKQLFSPAPDRIDDVVAEPTGCAG